MARERSKSNETEKRKIKQRNGNTDTKADFQDESVHQVTNLFDETAERAPNYEIPSYSNMHTYYPPSTYGNELYYEQNYNPAYHASTPVFENRYPAHTPSQYMVNNYQSQFYNHEPENIYFEESNAKTDGRGPVNLRFIEGKTRRGVTFSKRKKGLMKKAYELSVLTGSEVLVLVASEGGNVYSYATDRFLRIIHEHQSLIKDCLNNSPYVVENKENALEIHYNSDEESK